MAGRVRNVQMQPGIMSAPARVGVSGGILGSRAKARNKALFLGRLDTINQALRATPTEKITAAKQQASKDVRTVVEALVRSDGSYLNKKNIVPLLLQLSKTSEISSDAKLDQLASGFYKDKSPKNVSRFDRFMASLGDAGKEAMLLLCEKTNCTGITIESPLRAPSAAIDLHQRSAYGVTAFPGQVSTYHVRPKPSAPTAAAAIGARPEPVAPVAPVALSRHQQKIQDMKDRHAASVAMKKQTGEELGTKIEERIEENDLGAALNLDSVLRDSCDARLNRERSTQHDTSTQFLAETTAAAQKAALALTASYD